jgi:hypothetical protein
MVTTEEAIIKVTKRLEEIRSRYGNALNNLEKTKMDTLHKIENNTKNMLKNRVNWNEVKFNPNFNEAVSAIFENLRIKGLIDLPVIKTIEKNFDTDVNVLNQRYTANRETVEAEDANTIKYLEEQLNKLQAKLSKS